MSNVIQFLEALGQNPTRFSNMSYVAAVTALDLDNAQQQALLGRDHAALNDLLGGRTKMYCAVATPDDNEPQDDQNEPGDDDHGPDDTVLN